MAAAAHAALLFLIIFATAAAARPLREAEEHPAVVRAPGLAAPAEQHRRLMGYGVGAGTLSILVRSRTYRTAGRPRPFASGFAGQSPLAPSLSPLPADPPAPHPPPLRAGRQQRQGRDPGSR
jgi:hypothetical protein